MYVGANMKVDVDMHLMLCQKFGRDLLKHRNLPIDFNRLSQVQAFKVANLLESDSTDFAKGDGDVITLAARDGKAFEVRLCQVKKCEENGQAKKAQNTTEDWASASKIESVTPAFLKLDIPIGSI